MKMMVHLETTTSGDTLTKLMSNAFSSNGDGIDCRIYSIERRTQKDAVDGLQGNSQGRWPFTYLMEMEAYKRQEGGISGPNLPASTMGVEELLRGIVTQTQKQASPDSKLVCLGVWPIQQLAESN
jgi:hypothetical protein